MRVNLFPFDAMQVRNNKKTAVLAVLEPSQSNKKREKNERMFIIYRPNTGMQMKQESYADLKKKYKKVTPDEAQEHWEEQFKASSHICSHAYWLVQEWVDIVPISQYFTVDRYLKGASM